MSTNNISGIYKITCVPTGKVYVGSAVWVAKRWRNHREDLRKQTHHNDYLQKAWNKYGEEQFIFEVLEEVPKDSLAEREQYYMDAYQVCDQSKGFNLYPTARSAYGYKHTDAARENMAKGRIGIKLGDEQIESIRNRMKGNSLALGYKFTPEQINHLKEIRVGRTPALGMKHTEEAKAKMSERHKGKTISPETRAKMSAALLGKKQSDDVIYKRAANQCRFNEDQIAEIHALIKDGMALHKIGKQFGCCAQTICNIKLGRRMVYGSFEHRDTAID